jgi:hypothetical protein
MAYDGDDEPEINVIDYYLDMLQSYDDRFSDYDEDDMDHELISSHGSTTDYELEQESYWLNLKAGMLSHPAPLQIQCLLYIIGHLEEFPAVHLGLLSARVRRELLLLLPAVDVCRMELATPPSIVNDIQMDEVWHSLYNDRMPHGISEFKPFLMEPARLFKNFGIVCSWKEAYFQSFFNLISRCTSRDFTNDYNCDCLYQHFVSDILFGVYSFSNAFDAYIFDEEQSASLYNLHRYARDCPRFTRFVYLDKFIEPGTPFRSCSSHHLTHLDDLIELFSVIRAPIKLFMFDDDSLRNVWLDSYLYSSGGIECLFASLERFIIEANKFKHASHKLKLLMQAVFSSQCKVRGVYSTFDAFKDIISSHLNKDCNLKVLKIVGVNSFNVEIGNILQQLDGLEEVHITSSFKVENDNCKALFRSVIELMYKPSLQKLYLDHGCANSLLLISILRQFFASPYSITLDLNGVRFDSDFGIKEGPFELRNMSSKSLSIEGFSLPVQSLHSLLPPILHFRRLEIISTNSLNILEYFVQMESIIVEEKFIFKTYLFLKEKSAGDVCSLFRIVTAKEYDIQVHLNDDSNIVDLFINALANVKGKICSLSIPEFKFADPFETSGYPSVQLSSVLSLLRMVFNRLDSSIPPYFTLKLKRSSFNEESLKSLYDTWESCGGIRLKKLNMAENDSLVESETIKLMLTKMSVEHII